MRRVLFLAALLLTATGCASLRAPVVSDGGWRLVYAVGADGQTHAGDKLSLTRAVRAGLPVRVGWGIRWTGADGFPGGIEHASEAGLVSLYKGEVFAQLPATVVQRPDPAAPDLSLATDGSRVVMVLDTTGRLQVIESPGGKTSSQRVAIYWYVPWRSEHGPAAVDVPERLN
jgi:hypothetical protein